MSTAQRTFAALPHSPPAPTDIGAYARSMHQHTKRQMESIPQTSPRSSSTGSGDSVGNSSGAQHHHHSSSSSGSTGHASGRSTHRAPSPTGLPDGVIGRSSRDSSQYSYRT
ncbi:uncharacterized protein C8A04DRAFT_25021 [Dichotomopilus funicola]|uniref:Uncharacterized protein n=1 Tax=Dichotomopilus funicola TaxID=1934379 RepID=A0AAN6ZQL0_9PEZI|nr:hypothetical protein C8A04DRAFT_25021 [Dichotomopilus funicola]